MPSGSLLVVAGISFASGLVFAVIAATHARREVSLENRKGRDAHVAWWTGLAAMATAEGAQNAAGALGFADPTLHLSIIHLLLAGITLAIWGFVDYILHIYGARPASRLAFALHMTLGYFVMNHMLLAMGVEGVIVGTWRVDPIFGNDIGPLASILTAAFLVAPAFAAIVAYGMLFNRAEGHIHRFRISTMFSGLTVWLVGVAILDVLTLERDHPLAGLESLPLLLFAAFAAFAHAPPSVIRKKLAASQTLLGVK